MGEMIERVARAMFPNEWKKGCIETQALLYRRKDAVKKAILALNAMRVPTLEMEVVGTEQWMREAATEDRAKVNWQAMIDVALNSTCGTQEEVLCPSCHGFGYYLSPELDDNHEHIKIVCRDAFHGVSS